MKKLVAVSIAMILAGLFSGCVEESEVGEANIPPEAIISGPNIALVGSVVTFSSKSTDSDGEIVSYEWDFDDGSYGSGSRVSHIYNVGRIYWVTLKVTDDGSSSDLAVQYISIMAKDYHFSYNHTLSTDPPSSGEEKYGIDIEKYYNFTSSIDMPSGKWNATIWAKSLFARVRLSVIAYDEEGEEISALESEKKLLWLGKEEKIEISGDFKGGKITKIGIYFSGWYPGSHLSSYLESFNITGITLMYGGNHPSRISFNF